MLGENSPHAGTERSAPATAMLTVARARVLDAVREAPGQVGAHELSVALGLHPTTVRFHLDRLVAEGLVSAEPRRAGGPGRPAMSYRALPSPGNPSGSASDVWRPMVEALADALDGEGPDSVEKAVAAGGAWARQLLHDGSSGASGPSARSAGADAEERTGTEEQVGAVLARLGFSPRATPWGFALHSCPFLSSAQRHPEVICAVHLGLARGLARQTITPGAPGAPGNSGGVQLRPFAEPGACHLVFGPPGLNTPATDHPVPVRTAVPSRHADDVERTPR